jgi:hypothetical protein
MFCVREDITLFIIFYNSKGLACARPFTFGL